MAPKNFKHDYIHSVGSYGPTRRQQMLDEIADHMGYLPQGVDIADLDLGFNDFINKELLAKVKVTRLDDENELVPLVAKFMTINRVSQLQRENGMDKNFDGNIALPFATIERDFKIETGTGQGGYFNIPGDRNYHMVKVPRWDGNIYSVDVYQIPQPTAVDLKYTFTLLTMDEFEINSVSEKMAHLFKSKQHYVKIKGHFMPILWEGAEDASEKDTSKRVFYKIQYSFTLKGYIQDPAEFKTKESINRTLEIIEAREEIERPKRDITKNFDTFKYDVAPLSIKEGYTIAEIMSRNILYKAVSENILTPTGPGVIDLSKICFYGSIKSSDRPIADTVKGLIETNAASVTEVDDMNTLTIQFNSESDDYNYFALSATLPIKTTWFIDEFNTDDIGGPVGLNNNLFPDPDTITVTINGTDYIFNIYIANYNSDIDIIQLINE